MPRGLKADVGRSYAVIEAAARKFRQQMGMPLDGPLNCLALFESLNRVRVELPGGRSIPLSYGVNEMPAEALTIYDDQRDEILVALSPDTYADLEDDRARARFSVG